MKTARISLLLKSVIFLIALLALTSTVRAQTATAPSGSGTAIEPYLITSLENLYWIAQNSSSWDKYFEQTIDIDASATSTWPGGEGWTPIGNFSTYFTGSYDGGGFAIDGLTINRPSTSVQGLFGVIFQGSVANLGMTNVTIAAQMNVGALTGYLYMSSSMSNCYSTGAITGESYVAGLAGNVSESSTIITSLSYCSITATSQSAGGLVGRVDNSSIENSCFLGSVSGNEYAGGISGFLYQSTVSNCYSAGSVSGSSSIGGLIGASNSSTVTNSFWDTEASGRSTSSGGTGKTTAEMKLQSTFTDAGWDFEGETTNGTDDYWNLNDPVVYNDGYPFLSWQEGTDVGMPVELVSFTATINTLGVELAWKTATEVNNYGFEIEKGRMKDELGIMNWEKIGFVEGNGTTNAPKSYTFVDGSASGTVVYRLKQIDRDGSFEYTNQVEVTVATPEEFSLMQNHPNPFNPTTAINYTLPVAGHVSLKIYDMLGKEVATLVNGVQDAGVKIAQFNASQLPSGMYFYTLRTDNFAATKKMLLLK